jgi:hypothetical protein
MTVVSDRDVAGYLGRRERAGLQIDEGRDDEKTQSASSERQALPFRPPGLGDGRLTPLAIGPGRCRKFSTPRRQGGGPSRIRVPFQPLEVGSHLRSALIAQIAVFLQCLVDNRFDLRRKLWIEMRRRTRVLV